jgi:hypothetical protein
MSGQQILEIRGSKPKLPNFTPVKFGQLIQQSFTFRQNVNLHDPVVAVGPALSDKPVAFGALHQPDNGVVALLQEFGELSDGGPSPARKTCDAQEQLMLLRRQAVGAGGPFAEAEKFPELIPEIRQPAEAANPGGFLGMT